MQQRTLICGLCTLSVALAGCDRLMTSEQFVEVAVAAKLRGFEERRVEVADVTGRTALTSGDSSNLVFGLERTKTDQSGKATIALLNRWICGGFFGDSDISKDRITSSVRRLAVIDGQHFEVLNVMLSEGAITRGIHHDISVVRIGRAHWP